MTTLDEHYVLLLVHCAQSQ